MLSLRHIKVVTKRHFKFWKLKNVRFWLEFYEYEIGDGETK